MWFFFVPVNVKIKTLSSVVRHLASGSGDTTVRFWDINTETPEYRCKGSLKLPFVL